MSAGGERAGAERIMSLDVMRGIVMVLMAIDHVRVYAAVPAGGPAPGVFFTRWITHFVAPWFCFLAGTGAFLHGRKLGDMRALSRYLALRGALLVLLELTILRVSWTFNLDFANYNIAGVIWMLGWCMVMLAALVRLPVKVVGWGGVAMIALQQVFQPITSALPQWLASILYQGGETRLGPGGPPLLILYVLIPWIGVMAAGYGFGALLTRPPDARRRLFLRAGLGMTAVFIVVATLAAVMRPGDGQVPLFARILGQQKYPPSQLFLLMTLGPMIALLPWAEQVSGKVRDVLSTFGRVPMFYYLLHIPLIHALALVVSLVREGRVDTWLFSNFPLAPPAAPAGYRWSLALLYLVWLIAVALLYVPCRWYARVKSRSPQGWLRYL
ncbi:MAG: heparan-alpha-glucosaminide N-acetyltransferase domain-containing protein [Gemmatimonadaceae bacterium]